MGAERSGADIPHSQREQYRYEPLPYAWDGDYVICNVKSNLRLSGVRSYLLYLRMTD